MSNFSQRKLNGGNDDYFTKPTIAKKIIDNVLEKIPNNKNTLFVEPSAGNGVFSSILLAKNKKVISYDIAPQGDNIIKKDFLALNFQKENIKNAIFIGNPPFGTCSHLAVKFFNKASEVAEYIAFILPRTFRKVSIQKRIHKHFHLIHDEILQKNSFIVGGKEHNVPTIFQIWKKEKTPRVFNNVENKYIDWVSKEKALFAIRRVGGNAGAVYTKGNFENFSLSSNYFCIERKKGVMKILKTANFSNIINNTVGVRSLSKIEIVSYINNYYANHKIANHTTYR